MADLFNRGGAVFDTPNRDTVPLSAEVINNNFESLSTIVAPVIGALEVEGGILCTDIVVVHHVDLGELGEEGKYHFTLITEDGLYHMITEDRSHYLISE